MNLLLDLYPALNPRDLWCFCVPATCAVSKAQADSEL